MEYAPYGNLNILRWRYRAFNRYLPELFLWHLFNSLAQAVEAMEKDALTGDTIGSLQRHKNDFILHLDIKPENIFLGYEETHAERRPEAPWRTGGLVEPLYPSVKMGDFGLAQYSYEGDDQDVPEPAENPRGLLWQGTPGFKAPVCTFTCSCLRKCLTAARSKSAMTAIGSLLRLTMKTKSQVS